MEMQMETVTYAFTQIWVCQDFYLNQRFAPQQKKSYFVKCFFQVKLQNFQRGMYAYFCVKKMHFYNQLNLVYFHLKRKKNEFENRGFF